MSVVPFARAEAAFRAGEMSITLLGATGSVGTSTIDLVRAQRDRFRIEAVTAQRNAAALAKLARDLRAKFAVVADPDYYGELEDALAGSGIEAAAGAEAIVEAAQRPADWEMASITGAAGVGAPHDAGGCAAPAAHRPQGRAAYAAAASSPCSTGGGASRR